MNNYITIVFKITKTTAYQYTLSVHSTHEYYYQGQFMHSRYTTEFHAYLWLLGCEMLTITSNNGEQKVHSQLIILVR